MLLGSLGLNGDSSLTLWLLAVFSQNMPAGIYKQCWGQRSTLATLGIQCEQTSRMWVVL